jgi:hypothetical protein
MGSLALAAGLRENSTLTHLAVDVDPHNPDEVRLFLP